MDNDDEFPAESNESPLRPGVRITAVNGLTLIVQTDPVTQLTTLDVENPDGVFVGSRVLGREDLRLLVDALTAASERAKTSDVPVLLDVSQVIGRD